MASRKRLRVIESPDEQPAADFDHFRNAATSVVVGPDSTSKPPTSTLLGKTEAVCLPLENAPKSSIKLDPTTSANRARSKTRFSIRSLEESDQRLQLERDDSLGEDDVVEIQRPVNRRILQGENKASGVDSAENICDDDVVEIQRPVKRRRLNGETQSSGFQATEKRIQTRPTKRKRRPAKSAVAKKLINTPTASTDPPTRISLSDFNSVAKPEDYPPPLPSIHDKTLERQCFTHRSYMSSITDYERLEWLGDTFLNYCVARILYNRLPKSQEGELTMFRSHLIRNKNIREYALMYGFPKRLLRGEIGQKLGGPEKVDADTFEAYIGGVLMDQPETGEEVVFEWISKVTEPQINEFTKLRLGYNKKAILQLQARLTAENAAAPKYMHLRGTNKDHETEYACLVQGMEIVEGAWKQIDKDTWNEVGRGIGKTAKEAQIRAAMHVLEELGDPGPKGKVIFVETEEGEFEEVEVDI